MHLLAIILAIAFVPMLLPGAGAPFTDAPASETTPVTESAESEEDDLTTERIYCIAKTDEEAIRIGEAYGLTFTERKGVIAYFINETGTDTAKLIRDGIEKGLEPVSIEKSRNISPVESRKKTLNPNSERKHA